MNGWQPILTAPKDGTRVLLYRPGASTKVVCGRFHLDQFAKKPRPYWHHDLEGLYGRADARGNPPTRWMPLPDPPE